MAILSIAVGILRLVLVLTVAMLTVSLLWPYLLWPCLLWPCWRAALLLLLVADRVHLTLAGYNQIKRRVG